MKVVRRGLRNDMGSKCRFFEPSWPLGLGLVWWDYGSQTLDLLYEVAR